MLSFFIRAISKEPKKGKAVSGTTNTKSKSKSKSKVAPRDSRQKGRVYDVSRNILYENPTNNQVNKATKRFQVHKDFIRFIFTDRGEAFGISLGNQYTSENYLQTLNNHKDTIEQRTAFPRSHSLLSTLTPKEIFGKYLPRGIEYEKSVGRLREFRHAYITQA